MADIVVNLITKQSTQSRIQKDNMSFGVAK